MAKLKRFKTDFLFSTPRVGVSLGSVFNLSGNYYNFNYSDSGLEADMKAIASDWLMVGQDINDSMEKFDEDFNDSQLEFKFDEPIKDS